MIEAKVIGASGRNGNYSTSQAEHNAGITVNPGDEVKVIVYYHNGASDQNPDLTQTTARNVIVGVVDSASGAAAASHTLSAGIVADNATAVYSSDPSVGGDFTIHSADGSPVSLQLEPGTTFNITRTNSSPLSVGSVFGTNPGVNIGNVLACFQYQGYVAFTLKVSGQQQQPQNATIKVTKLVRNDTQNGSNSFAHSTTANTGDTTTFQVTVQNTSNTNATNVVVTDSIPSGLTYVMGSASVNPTSDFAHFPLGDIAANSTKTLTFRTFVQAQSGTITNTASAKGDNTNTDQDSASVTIQGQVNNNTTLSINKTVRNVTSGGSFGKNATAQTNDTVAYQIVVTNTGSATAQNVVLNDTMPTGIQLSSGSLTTNIGSLDSGNSRTVNLTATVTGGTGTYVNTATASASNAPSVSDSATVTVNQNVPQNTTLSINKTVRNATATNSAFSKNATAQTNDLVEYRVVVTNTGNINALNVALNDILPNGIQLTNGNLNSNMGTLTPGQSQTVNFTARVTGGQGSYLNTAMASASNASSVTDTATVTVNAVQQPGAITITKGVRDFSQGQTAYVTNTNVYNGDTLQYRVVVTNTGSSALTNLVITDQIPSGLSFIAGSLGLTMGNGTTPDNITVSSLDVNQSVTINFNAKVNATSGSLTNTAQACADAVTCKTASATVNVIQQAQSANLSISKLVRNVTQNTSFTKQVSANPGDSVQYQIQITATNNTANNVVVFENIPQFLNYLSGSAKLNGNNLSDNFINQPTNIGNLSSGQTATILFNATVSNSVSNGQTFITNTATASADNIGTVSDSATVVVNQGSSGFSQLSISKLVRNTNQNHGFQKTDSAQTNDTVEFQITVTNTGTQTINNVFVNDILPNGLSFNSGSITQNGNSNVGNMINNQMSIGSLNAGQTITILFRATVTAQSGSTLVNTAQAGGNNVSTVQDTATVFVTGVAGQNVNLVFSKTAFNDTKNVDATSVPADRENFITYTLTVRNTGNAPATNFVITDDLSNVLNNATMVDSQGGTMNGSVISWSPITIPAGSMVSKVFRVRVNFNLPTSGNLSLVNTYGNTVVVQIARPQVAGAVFVAPKTGSGWTYGFLFAGLLTAAFAIMKRKGILAAILAKIPRVRIE